jgi:hypothetical protein
MPHKNVIKAVVSQGSGFWVQRFRVRTTLNAEPLKP